MSVFIWSILNKWFAFLGALWLLTEILQYSSESLANELRPIFYVLVVLTLIVSIVWGIIECIPKRRQRFYIRGKDSFIELVRGDILKEKGYLIIGSNTDFHIDLYPKGKISPSSVQGQYFNKFVSDDSQVRASIDRVIRNGAASFGTTIAINNEKKPAFLCAISKFDGERATATFDQFQSALPVMWSFVSRNMDKDYLNVPILGTGFTRLDKTREEVIYEIVLSFLVSMRGNTYCDGLRVVIFPKDIKDYNINIDRVRKFIEHHCEYHLVIDDSKPKGRPAGAVVA